MKLASTIAEILFRKHFLFMQLCIWVVLILFAWSSHASASCMGADRRLCSFAKQHGLKVISGYRRGARIRGSWQLSQHAKRKAIDVKGRGWGWRGRIKRAANRRGLRVGIYCGRLNHMHIEIPNRRGNLRTFYKGCRIRRAGR